MSLREIVRRIGPLGFVCFGGPNIHIIIFRRLFVDSAQPWLDSTTYADLFSLSGALPGPGSTQLLFSIAIVRAGALAGFLAFFLWSLPGAFGMLALGLGVSHIPATLPPLALALLTGLNAASVGLIFFAAYQSSRSTATTPLTRLVLFSSASIAVCYTAVWLFPVLTLGGGVITLVASWPGWRELAAKMRRARHAKPLQVEEPVAAPWTTEEGGAAAIEMALEPEHVSPPPLARLPTPPPESASLRQRAHAIESGAESGIATRQLSFGEEPAPTLQNNFKLGIPSTFAVLALYLSILIVVLVLRTAISHPPRALQLFTNLFIAGSILFGGGPVVIPLLQGYTVTPGWVSSQNFLLGFAILQAFPGPNFNFSVFLGCLSLPHNPVLGGILAYLGIYTPGLLLKLALLPTYSRFRQHPIVRDSLTGLNSAASGLIWTAIYRLWRVGLLTQHSGASLEASGYWVVIAGAAFMASNHTKVPPPFVLLGGALAGLVYGAVKGAPRIA